jgi:glyoxylase-like metal-dependent hydrolase (beta-lactamase superfamily II)
MKVEKFINKILSSNSYILHDKEEVSIWIIDPGDSKQLINWIRQKNKIVKGILLTHSHIDHIYGVNDIIKENPNLEIYASKNAAEGLYSPKANGSYYMEMNYTVKSNEVNYLVNEDVIELWKGKTTVVFDTPGHDYDCISFYCNEYLFTGDALIPGIKPHLKSKKADKQSAYETISWIKKTFNPSVVICPGHKEICALKNIAIPL